MRIQKTKPPKNCKEIIQVCIWKEFTHLTILFLTAGKKKFPALPQVSLILALRILANLLISWQRCEWRQFGKTPAARLDNAEEMMRAVYIVGFISTAEEPATGDEGISANQVLAFPL